MGSEVIHVVWDVRQGVCGHFFGNFGVYGGVLGSIGGEDGGEYEEGEVGDYYTAGCGQWFGV